MKNEIFSHLLQCVNGNGRTHKSTLQALSVIQKWNCPKIDLSGIQRAVFVRTTAYNATCWKHLQLILQPLYQIFTALKITILFVPFFCRSLLPSQLILKSGSRFVDIMYKYISNFMHNSGCQSTGDRSLKSILVT